jgi:hypothetical protein
MLGSTASVAARSYWSSLAATTKVWLDETFPYDRSCVRVEWQTDHGPASSVATITIEQRRRRIYDVSLSWTLDTPPDDVERLVREVCIEREEERAAHGCFAGYETSSAMYGAAEEGERYAAWREAMEKAYEGRVVEIQDGAGNVTYRAPIAAGTVR